MTSTFCRTASRLRPTIGTQPSVSSVRKSRRGPVEAGRAEPGGRGPRRGHGDGEEGDGRAEERARDARHGGQRAAHDQARGGLGDDADAHRPERVDAQQHAALQRDQQPQGAGGQDRRRAPRMLRRADERREGLRTATPSTVSASAAEQHRARPCADGVRAARRRRRGARARPRGRRRPARPARRPAGSRTRRSARPARRSRSTPAAA